MQPDKERLEYVYFLKQLISGKKFEGPVLRIARQVVDKGLDSLSRIQAATLEIVINPLITEECNSCGNDIPWSEMYQAINSGRCLACISK